MDIDRSNETESVSGMVFDISRASIHDGPGIRSTVFLKGCPLSCVWCHNPESQSPAPEVSINADTGEATTIGKRMTVDEVMEIVLRDRPYYRNSEGGLTVSGGEPTMQMPFLLELLRRARKEGVSTALETCGFTGKKEILSLLPLVDYWLYDYKATDRAVHSEYTGVPSYRILENLRVLIKAGARIILRCPIIPGVNDSHEHFRSIATLVSRSEEAILEVELMPYTDLGNAKNRSIGCTDYFEARVPEPTEVTSWLYTLRELGVSNVSQG